MFCDYIYPPTYEIKPGKPKPRLQCLSYMSLAPDLSWPGPFFPLTTDRQSDLINQGRDVKKSTTVLDFMDY